MDGHMDDKVKLAEVASTLLIEALSEYVRSGGRLSDGARPLTPELVAAPNGGLPALLHWAEEYYVDYELPFASIDYTPDASAYLGVSVSSVLSDWQTKAFPLFTFSDFVVGEVLPSSPNQLDLAGVFQYFREWAAVRYGIPARLPEAVPKHLPS
jgi:hypothetical protein